MIDRDRALSTNNNAIPFDEDLVIITTNDAVDGLQDFVDWKQTLGYKVHLYAQSQWSTDQIKEKCIDCYHELDNLTNLILVGDTEHVPSIFHEYGYASSQYHDPSYYSDFHYSCLDGDDDYTPEFFIARVPFSSPNDIKTCLNKSTSYEKTKWNDSTKYNNHAICSLFEHQTYEYGADDYESEF